MANTKWRNIAELWEVAYRQEIRMNRIEYKEKQMSEQFDAIKAQVLTLSAEDDYLIQQFKDLKAKVDSGEVVTKQDLDDLQNALAGEVTKVHEAVAVADPDDPTTAPEPTDGGTVPEETPEETPVEVPPLDASPVQA